MTPKKINVLSLFDGVGTAYLALTKAGLEIENYYSSEIDPSALKVLEYHYSANTSFHNIGDVTKVDGMDYLDVDLVIYGSPCTQLSSVNPSNRTGLEGPDSSLFYEAIRLLKTIYVFRNIGKPLYFLMENVASMPNKDRDKITAELEYIFEDSVQLLKINSSLVSASNRRRYYWTNIPDVTIPESLNITFQDILENGFADREKANVLLSTNVTLTNGIFRYYKRNIGNIVFKNKSFAELPPEEKLIIYPEILRNSGYNGKAKSITDEYSFPNNAYRLPSVLELERLMSFPDGYISSVPNISRTEKKKIIGLSFTMNVVSHLLSSLKG